MRKALRILSYIGLAIATALIIFLFSNGVSVGPTNSAVALTHPFDNFPENEPQFIDFRVDEPTFSTFTDREKQDQLRDWLLFIIASDENFTAKDINQSLYDVSTTRQGYMQPVSNFEYGTTRSVYVGDGELVALIPAELESAQRTDVLAHIADKHRKDLGDKPKHLIVFEYELHPNQQYGLLTRREVISGQTFFQDAAGYIETRIATLQDLQQFMVKIDDLTYAQREGGLVLGGRKLQGQSYSNISVEDIAAIWQSEDKLHRDLEAFEAKWNAKLNQTPPSLQNQVQQQAQREAEALGIVNGSGFSLDPAYDYDGMFQVLAAAESGLKKLVVDGNSVFDDQSLQRAKNSLKPQAPGKTAFEVLGSSPLSAISTLPVKPNVVPYLEIIERLNTALQEIENVPQMTRSEANSILDLLDSKQQFQFQQARYDGNLQGTEVGMVLFYTDLIAKLWALNYNGSTPQSQIADFAPLTKVSSQISSIYKQEIENLPSTRLWFGPQDKGFQIVANNQLLFARNATRIYAASSNPLNPGEETQASANSEAFLGWWNNHYEEVAAYEPEYERLNEIMKWSLLISWLNDAESGSFLDFLKDVSVQRNLWFPDWASSKGNQLRFNDWQRVPFYPKGYLNTSTEALPRLKSEDYLFFGNLGYFSGGVSLADEALFQNRTALSKVDGLNDLVLRSNNDLSTLDIADNQIRFQNLEGAAYQLFDQQPTLASVKIQAKEGSKLRGRNLELANLDFVRDLVRTEDGLSITTSLDTTSLGQLKTKHTGNGFNVGWLSRDIDAGQNLLDRIKQAGNTPIEDVLKQDQIVAAAAKIDDGSYVVKLQGTEKWMQLEAGGGGGINLPPDWQAQLGSFPDDPDGGASKFLLRWVDDEQVSSQVNNGTAVMFIDESINGSPKGQPSVELISSVKQGDYSAAAKTIADDPQAAYLTLKQDLASELIIVDAFYQKKQMGKALQHIDGLIEVYGPQPELMLKKALIDIDRQRLTVRRIDPNSPITDVKASQEDFYDAVNDIFGSGDSDRYFRAVATDESVLYIQDSPTLNNVDFSPSTEDAFPFGSEARAYKLESGTIADAHIGGAGYDQPVATLLAGGGESGGPSGDASYQRFNLKNYSNLGLDDFGEDCEAEENKDFTDCPRDVYVVLDETTI